jgi:hypothetical protein
VDNKPQDALLQPLQLHALGAVKSTEKTHVLLRDRTYNSFSRVKAHDDSKLSQKSPGKLAVTQQVQQAGHVTPQYLFVDCNVPGTFLRNSSDPQPNLFGGIFPAKTVSDNPP